MQDADSAFNSSVPFVILLWSFQQQEQQRRNYERIWFLSVLVAWAALMVYTEIQSDAYLLAALNHIAPAFPQTDGR